MQCHYNVYTTTVRDNHSLQYTTARKQKRKSFIALRSPSTNHEPIQVENNLKHLETKSIEPRGNTYCLLFFFFSKWKNAVASFCGLKKSHERASDRPESPFVALRAIHSSPLSSLPHTSRDHRKVNCI